MTKKELAAIIKFAQDAAKANNRKFTASGTKLLESAGGEGGQPITYAMVEVKDGRQFQAYHSAVQGYTFLEHLPNDAKSCEVPAEKSSQLDSSPAPVLTGSLVEAPPAVDVVKADVAVQYIRRELAGVVNSFCRIGFMLRKVREEKLFQAYDCKNIVEFGEKLFSLKRASINNYILVCEKFSRPDENGQPTEVLADSFLTFSFTQLTEIMRLPEGKAEEVTPEMSCKEIRSLGRDEESSENEKNDPSGMLDTTTLFCRTLTKENFDVVIKLLKDHIGETILIEASPA